MFFSNPGPQHDNESLFPVFASQASPITFCPLSVIYQQNSVLCKILVFSPYRSSPPCSSRNCSQSERRKVCTIALPSPLGLGIERKNVQKGRKLSFPWLSNYNTMPDVKTSSASPVWPNKPSLFGFMSELWGGVRLPHCAATIINYHRDTNPLCTPMS